MLQDLNQKNNAAWKAIKLKCKYVSVTQVTKIYLWSSFNNLYYAKGSQMLSFVSEPTENLFNEKNQKFKITSLEPRILMAHS